MQYRYIIIIFGLSALSASLLSMYFFTKNNIKKDKIQKKPTVNQSQTKVQSDKKEKLVQITESYEQKFIRIRNQIRDLLQVNGNQLTKQVVSALIRGQYELARSDMETLHFDSRRQRRQKINDLQEYAQLTLKSVQDEQDIQQKHLGSLLSWFNIDIKTWKEAELKIQKMRVEGSTYSQLIDIEQKKQFESYSDSRIEPKNYEEIETILNYKLEVLKNFDIMKITKITSDYEMYTVIETYLQDQMSLKYKIQEQDILHSISLLKEDQKQKINQLLNQITQQIQQLVTVINEDSNQNEYS